MNVPAFDPQQPANNPEKLDHLRGDCEPAGAPALPPCLRSPKPRADVDWFRGKIMEAAEALNGGGTIDLRALYERACKANPAIREFDEESMRRAEGQAGVCIANSISEAILLPHDELMIFNLVGAEQVELVSANVIRGSWREWPGLENEAVWSADLRARNISTGLFGMSVRACAFVEPRSARSDALEFFGTLQRGAWNINPFLAELGVCFKEGMFTSEDYALYMGEHRLRHKLLQQSRDYLLAAHAVADPTLDPLERVGTIVRPDGSICDSLRRLWGDKDDLRVMASIGIDLSGMMGGIIAEMEEHLRNDREELAYCAFLDCIAHSALLAGHEPASFRELIELSTAVQHLRILDSAAGGSDPLELVRDGAIEPVQLMRDAYALAFIPNASRGEWLAGRRSDRDPERLTFMSSDRQVIERLGQHVPEAVGLTTTLVLERTPIEFFVDLDRAELRGALLAAAFKACDEKIFMFIDRVHSDLPGLAQAARRMAPARLQDHVDD